MGDDAPLQRSEGALVVDAARVHEDLKAAQDLRADARAVNTRRAYDAVWKQFAFYCAVVGAPALPASPLIVAAYLGARVNGRAPRPPLVKGWQAFVGWQTIATTIAAIAARHRAGGHPVPTDHPAVREVLDGAARNLGRSAVKKAPLLVDDLRRLHQIRGEDDSREWRLTSAVLLVGFALGARRSELVALDVEHLSWTPEGVTVTIARGKTDQHGHGREAGLTRRPELCPVLALETWLRAEGITDGPVFRDPRHGRRLRGLDVAAIVKGAATDLGHDPDAYGAHSLRRGLAVEAMAGDVPMSDLMKHVGWKNATTALGYAAQANVYRTDASRILR